MIGIVAKVSAAGRRAATACRTSRAACRRAMIFATIHGAAFRLARRTIPIFFSVNPHSKLAK